MTWSVRSVLLALIPTMFETHHVQVVGSEPILLEALLLAQFALQGQIHQLDRLHVQYAQQARTQPPMHLPAHYANQAAIHPLEQHPAQPARQART